jgi:SAM-dependent methyltransferase
MVSPILEPGETRTLERVRFHFEVERELADRLRHGSRAERATLYSAVYDELFRRVPDHPQLTRRRDAEALRAKVEPQLQMLRRYLTPETVYLELGAGDCAVSVAVAPLVRKVYAVDVSAEIARVENPPANFQLVLSDGTNIPVPAASVDLVYSNQLMEHLHPDDALEQLRAVHACLAPGGRYLCVTPNRLSGPHDISKYFEESARGFHLKEYTACELARIFREAGFSQVRALHGGKGRFVESAAAPLVLLEKVIGCVPARVRRALGRQAVFRALLGIQLIGIK